VLEYFAFIRNTAFDSKECILNIISFSQFGAKYYYSIFQTKVVLLPLLDRKMGGLHVVSLADTGRIYIKGYLLTISYPIYPFSTFSARDFGFQRRFFL
jgi:hypothetical protein